MTKQSVAFLNAYKFYEKGLFPNPGEWTRQPVKFLEAMHIIASEIERIREDDRAKNK